MASQMGKTDSILNVIGHRLDDDPAPINYIGPTKSNVERVISKKLDRLINNVPSLKLLQSSAYRQSMTFKEIAGIPLRLAWAGSASEMSSDSAALVFLDEVDRMGESVGGEGDPFELGEARTGTYPDGTTVGTSTPTIGNVETYVHPQTNMEHWAVSDSVGSAIWRRWQEGTRHEWAWPCPDCEEYFIPRLKNMSWPEGATASAAEQKAVLVCPNCGSCIRDNKKSWMNSRGRYVTPGQSVDKKGNVVGVSETAGNRTASFWVSGICSFSAKKSFGYLAKKFVSAAHSHEQERVQAVINIQFGELFRVQGEAPEWESVLNRRKPYASGDPQIKNGFITCGVDVQKDRLVYVVRQWGEAFESYALEIGELWGETDKPPVWAQLSALLTKPYSNNYIRTMVVDSGYRTNEVYTFCINHEGVAFPAKGHETLDMPIKANTIEVNMSGKRAKTGLKLWHYDSDICKSFVHARINWDLDKPGGWWLPSDASEDYCKQIVAEQRVIKPSGAVKWVLVKKNNHYLDCEALNYVGIRIWTGGQENRLSTVIPNENGTYTAVRVQRRRGMISKGIR